METAIQSKQKFDSFESFWPFYLSQHQNPICRKLHLIGTSLGGILFVSQVFFHPLAALVSSLIIGYGFAWVGHFGFEKNKPASFSNPGWSFKGDWLMLKLYLEGKLQTEINLHLNRPLK